MIRDDEVYELTMARRELARKLRDTTAALEDCRRALAELVRRGEDPDLAHNVTGAWTRLGVALQEGRDTLHKANAFVKVQKRP